MDMNTELKFVQINLARCFQANESLNTFQAENIIDVSVVQESYHVQGKIIGFPIKTLTTWLPTPQQVGVSQNFMLFRLI